MKIEWLILIVAWVITFGLIFIIPKNKRRLAIVAYLFKQVITWIVGILVVNYGLVSYPVRLFSNVNRTSFSYEYFIFPVTCAIFNVFYPENRSNGVKVAYYFSFCTALTMPEIFIEKHTQLIHYIHWTWYWTWITLFMTFLLTRLFCKWFFRGI